MKICGIRNALKAQPTIVQFHHVDPGDIAFNPAKMYQLTHQQIESFHKDGFLVVKASEHKLVDPQALKQWTEEVESWPKEFGKWMPYEEVTPSGKRQLMRTEKFVDYHAGLQELLCGDALRSTLKQLSDDSMTLFKDKINYKLAGAGGFGAHLDAPAYNHVGKIHHLTANVAVDEATPANGCLEVVPGSHKMSVQFQHGGHITNEWENSHEWIEVPLQPGDILFFGSYLAHRSGPNRTDKSRVAIYATYNRVSDGTDLRERYYVDRRANFPPAHEIEVGKDYSVGWERYGFAAPFSKEDLPTSVRVAAS